ncbi:MAG: DUF4349 domain-containing protein [Planctomycetota bacterium]|jgi:hypothetical protein
MSTTLKLSAAIGFTVCLLIPAGCSDSGRHAYTVADVPSERLAEKARFEGAGGFGEAELAEHAPPAKSFQGVKAPETNPARTERLVVYNAVMKVVVERIYESMDRIKTAVADMGGYMQEMDSRSMTFKVPADKFQNAIAEVEKLGEVTQKDIKGTDVTEEMRDLNIRLQNAEQLRQRLLKLFERADKVEDALRIERELARVTETIELLKGKIAYLKNSVAFCTLTVHFNSPVPQEDISIKTPFRWVHALGSGLISPDVEYPYQSGSFGHRALFDLPKGYIRYFDDGHRTRAMSAAGIRIYAHKEKNYKGGDIDFWAPLVRRVLTEQKVVHISSEQELGLHKKRVARLLIGSKQIGSKQYGYMVGTVVSKKHIYIFEAWGALDEFNKDRDKLEIAVKSLRIR